MTAQQRRFNTVLSSLRQKVEHAIGLLKGRWRRLLFLDFLDLRLAVHFIIATCVLHNFCILHDDFYDGYLMDDGSDNHYDDGDHCPGGTAEQKRTHNEHCLCINYSENNTVYHTIMVKGWVNGLPRARYKIT